MRLGARSTQRLTNQLRLARRVGRWRGPGFAGSFATTNSAQDGDSREQTALGNREPRGSLGGQRLARVAHFADDKKEVVSLTGIGILGKATWRDGAARFQSKDVEAGKRRRADQVRGGEQERVVEVFETGPLLARRGLSAKIRRRFVTRRSDSWSVFTPPHRIL